MEKKIENGFIVLSKTDGQNTVGCHIPMNKEYNEEEIEIELDIALENLRLKDELHIQKNR